MLTVLGALRTGNTAPLTGFVPSNTAWAQAGAAVATMTTRHTTGTSAARRRVLTGSRQLTVFGRRTNATMATTSPSAPSTIPMMPMVFAESTSLDVAPSFGRVAFEAVAAVF